MEIYVMAWGRHKNVAGLNWSIRSQYPDPYGQAKINKQQLQPVFCFPVYVHIPSNEKSFCNHLASIICCPVYIYLHITSFKAHRSVVLCIFIFPPLKLILPKIFCDHLASITFCCSMHLCMPFFKANLAKEFSTFITCWPILL